MPLTQAEAARVMWAHDNCVQSRNDYLTATGAWDKRRFRMKWKENEQAFADLIAELVEDNGE